MTSNRLSDYRGLAPLICGLALMRFGSIVANYGSYRYTDVNLITDGSNLAGLSLLALPILLLALRQAKLPDKALSCLMIASVALQGLTLLGLILLNLSKAPPHSLYPVFNILHIVGSTGAMFYWVRQTLGSSTPLVVLTAFAAMLISEPLTLVATYLTEVQALGLAAFAVLLQYPCLWACRQPRIAASLQSMQSVGGFAFERRVMESRPILVVMFVGFALTGLCLGFLRGYPAGQSIAFTDTTRLLQALLTIGVEGFIILIALRGRSWLLIATMWAFLQILISLALVSYAVFPGMLDIGAIFITTANAFMTAFAFYLYALFMNCFGRFDPYVYAFPIRVTWLFARAFARLFLLSLPFVSNNTVLIISLVGFILLTTAQIVFLVFFNRLQNERGAPWQGAAIEEGLPEHKQKSATDALPSSMSRLPLRMGVRKIGEQFLLSEREIDVLVLFAMGHKQKKVAEALYISPGTVHAHIKRIYRKTGFHSRQDVLDYIKQYVRVEQNEGTERGHSL
ncbi:MAG: helix-turn-helix transcriptional regulator [Coriobacteriales bacterium]|jgi:DNA-binding CsgD family transcriptional regulator|nr:helix-turn-helix transcriptional regulator [Coriobacteriales bacterium]